MKFKYIETLPLFVGEIISHEDYTAELFTVTEIDGDIVTTSGGKNGTWINDIDLIIRNPVEWEFTGEILEKTSIHDQTGVVSAITDDGIEFTALASISFGQIITIYDLEKS